MFTPTQRRVLIALREVQGLPEADCLALAGLNLPLYDTLVIAYLRLARLLLADDASFNVLGRSEVWDRWYRGMLLALDGALRFRENIPLTITLGVISTLLPGLYPRASLRGFKMLQDALREAQRGGGDLRRQRSRQRIRLQDIIFRTPLWVGPAGDIVRDSDLSSGERASLLEQGYREVWGATFIYYRPDSVLPLIEAVLSVMWKTVGNTTLVAPRV